MGQRRRANREGAYPVTNIPDERLTDEQVETLLEWGKDAKADKLKLRELLRAREAMRKLRNKAEENWAIISPDVLAILDKAKVGE